METISDLGATPTTSWCPVAVTKEGWMDKKGGSRRNWNKRWFVLKGCRLLYYATDKAARQDNSKEKGVIELTQHHIVQSMDHHTRCFCFTITCPATERRYEFSCSSADIKHEWLEHVSNAASPPSLSSQSAADIYNSAEEVDEAEVEPEAEDEDEDEDNIYNTANLTGRKSSNRRASETLHYDTKEVTLVRGVDFGLALESIGEPPVSRVMVCGLEEGSPAALSRAVEVRDILISIDGEDIRDFPFGIVLEKLHCERGNQSRYVPFEEEDEGVVVEQAEEDEDEVVVVVDVVTLVFLRKRMDPNLANCSANFGWVKGAAVLYALPNGGQEEVTILEVSQRLFSTAIGWG
jgi:hypothetical protein